MLAYLKLRGSRRSGRTHRISAMHFGVGVGDAATTEAVEVEKNLRFEGDSGVRTWFKDVEARDIGENNCLKVERV